MWMAESALIKNNSKTSKLYFDDYKPRTKCLPLIASKDLHLGRVGEVCIVSTDLLSSSMN
jgi:hypothetical protein